MIMLLSVDTLARLRCDYLENTSALGHRQIDGKIKEMPPRGSQATGVACFPAGASVGARAARRQNTSKNNVISSTIRAIAIVGVAARPVLRPRE